MGATLEAGPKPGTEQAQGRVMIVDFDGVIARRQLALEVVDAAKVAASSILGRFIHHAPKPYIPEIFSIEGNETSDRKLSLKTAASLYLHNRRFPIKRAVHEFTEGLDPHDRLIIVTGRPDFALFRDMSVDQKNRFGLAGAEIILAPIDPDGKKRSSIDTKYNAVALYGATDVYDDDRATSEVIALGYPDVRVHRIKYSGDSSPEVLAKCPRMEVIPASEWLKPVQADPSKGDSLTRNSSLRSKLAFKKKIARAVVEVFPLNPNLVTGAGGILTLKSVIELTKKNLDGKSHFFSILPATGKLVGALLLDLLDGGVAEAMNTLQPGSHDKKVGGAFDAAVDKAGTLIMSEAKMVIAYRRRDWYGLGVAALSGASHTLSALYRAKGEARGEKFPENGRIINPLSIFGTQLGRNLLAIPSTVWPNLGINIAGRWVTLPDVADTISAISNFYVAWQRSRGGEEIKLPEAPEGSKRTKKYREWKHEYEGAKAKKLEIMEEGKYRAKWMRWVAIGSVGGVTILGSTLFLYDKFLKRK